MYRKGGIHPSPAPRAAAHAPGGYGIRPYRRGRRPRRPADVHRTAKARGTHICVPYNRRGGIHAAREPSAAANVKSPPHVGAGRLTAHNERRQPAKLARSCGCLPRGGKHCSLPSFAALNCGPVLATPQRPALHLPTNARRRDTPGPGMPGPYRCATRHVPTAATTISCCPVPPFQ